MLDKLEYHIAKELADHHFYPFAEHNYLKIFNAFSYFPINFKDIGIKEEGKTVTFLALVVYYCFVYRQNSLNETYVRVLNELKKIAQPYFPQDIVVETFLGCILYHHHPSNINNILSSIATSKILDKNQTYEYEIKKKTILIYAI
ncbi:MAG: hypothetical protein KAS18_06950 [Calditrichia bacterium]|nr:hypothetical protein [Calditrichia bacterium]